MTGSTLSGYAVGLARPRMARGARLAAEARPFTAATRLGPGSVAATGGPIAFVDGMFYRDPSDRVHFVPAGVPGLPPALWRVAGFAVRTAQATARGRVLGITEGCRIATPEGERPIERIVAGDLVLTRDRGPMRVRWTGRAEGPGDGPAAPIRIRPGVVDRHGAELTLAPWQRLFFEGERARLLFGVPQALVAAETLIDGLDVCRVPRARVHYHQVAFDTAELVFVNGVPCQSLPPEDLPYCADDLAGRERLLQAFPRLGQDPLASHRPVRRSLDRTEAQLLLAAMGYRTRADDAGDPA